MDHVPLTPDDHETQAWLAELLAETGPESAYLIAELLGIDLDDAGDG